MARYVKKTTVTVLPEWEPLLKRLKQDRFRDETDAEMFRYLIGRGLATLKVSHKAGRPPGPGPV